MAKTAASERMAAAWAARREIDAARAAIRNGTHEPPQERDETTARPAQGPARRQPPKKGGAK